MSKRAPPTQLTDPHIAKRARCSTFSPIKVAAHDAAARVDSCPPLTELEDALNYALKKPRPGKCVLYWMRMSDLRIQDNRALSRASDSAQEQGLPLVALFVISPQDYVAHDRGAKKIDFTLRNLAMIQKKLLELNIPLHVENWDRRKQVPERLLSFCEQYSVSSLFANIEYEVDELRRDIEFCNLAQSTGLQVDLHHNKCIIEPGIILNKQSKAYAIYSPYLKVWEQKLNGNLPYYLEECPYPKPNDASFKDTKFYSPLFSSIVPHAIDGFELEETDRQRMEEVWPTGEDSAQEVLLRFLTCKTRSSQLGHVNPLSEGSEKCEKQNRAAKYGDDRDKVDSDTSSRLSPYLSSGIISIRQCVRSVMSITKRVSVDCSRQNGFGRWIQELAWRDFYNAVLASYPRVSMGRPFLEKFAPVVWEAHQAPSKLLADDVKGFSDSEAVTRWKNGTTGVPIVDATMRCLKQMGWVHNRCRMITAMYLTKDLMVDWRVGERHFMEQLIDGDLASNNGGWQWSASTGVDPCPYFRIFNPYTQSRKADPTGGFIRHYVPELSKLSGNDLHDPPPAVAKKLGYPLPIIRHNEARERALRRYKNPGTV